MKKRLSVFLGLFAVLLLTSACQNQKDLVSKKNDARGILVNEWIEASNYVAETTKDELALEVMKFVRENAVMAIPGSDGYFVPEEALKNPRGFGILVALEGDEKINADLNMIIGHENIGASFNPDNHIMIIRGNVEMSKIWKGLLFLHECAHAFIYLNAEEKYDWKNEQLYCYEEKDVHEFQNRLTVILGGPKFVSFIKKEVEKIGKDLPKKFNKKDGLIIVNNQGWNLSEFFGPALSEFEEKLRGSSLAIEINFKLLEKKFKGDIEDKKAASLYSRYEESGILPLK